MRGVTSIDPRWHAVHEDGTPFPGLEHPAMVALRTRQAVRDVVMGIFNPQLDSQTWINVCATPISDDGSDQTIGVYTVFQDITEHKQAEAALSESRWLLQTVIDTAPIRVFWKDRDLRYLGCNPAFAKDAGRRDPGEVIGTNDYQLGWAESAELYRADDRKVIETGVAKLSYEEPQTTPDGRTIWLRTSKVPLRNHVDETIGVLGIYDDITDQLGQAAALGEARQFSDDLINGLPGIFFLLDETGRIVRWNDQLIQITGLPAETIGRMNGMDFFAGDDVRRIAAAISDAQRTGEVFIEADLCTADGQAISHLFTGRRTMVDGRPYLVGLGIDIARRKVAEAALREREMVFSAIVNRAVEGMLLVDAETMEFSEFNDAACQGLGYTREEFARLKLPDVQGSMTPEETWEKVKWPRQHRADCASRTVIGTRTADCSIVGSVTDRC